MRLKTDERAISAMPIGASFVIKMKKKTGLGKRNPLFRIGENPFLERIAQNGFETIKIGIE